MGKLKVSVEEAARLAAASDARVKEFQGYDLSRLHNEISTNVNYNDFANWIHYTKRNNNNTLEDDGMFARSIQDNPMQYAEDYREKLIMDERLGLQQQLYEEDSSWVGFRNTATDFVKEWGPVFAAMALAAVAMTAAAGAAAGGAGAAGAGTSAAGTAAANAATAAVGELSAAGAISAGTAAATTAAIPTVVITAPAAASGLGAIGAGVAGTVAAGAAVVDAVLSGAGAGATPTTPAPTQPVPEMPPIPEGPIPQVIIPGTAPTTGVGLGEIAAGAGAVGAVGAIGNGPVHTVEVPGQRPPQPEVDPNIPTVIVPGTLPPGGLPDGVSDNLPQPDNDLTVIPPIGMPTDTGVVQPPAFPNQPIPDLSNIPLPPVTAPNTPNTPNVPNTPSTGTPNIPNLGSWLPGLLGAYTDYKNSTEDTAFWKSQMDTLLGMYKPGTPEANLMQQQMEAKDAATGRRSQYGVRSVDLANKLAQNRAQIMTSPTYLEMAEHYRDRWGSRFNSAYGAAGNQQGLGGLLNGVGNSLGTWIGNGLGSLFN